MTSSANTYPDVETSSTSYANRFGGDVGAWLLAVQAQGVKALCRDVGLGQGAALDFGGGHAQLIEPLNELGFRVSILSSAEICYTLVKPFAAQARCDFIVGDLLSSGLADEQFALVTCIRFLTHCPEWPRAVRELCRLSKGAVLVDYPPLLSSNLMYPLLFKLKKKWEGNTRAFTLFKHAEIDAEFAKCGFKLAGRYGQFFLPMVFHRKLNAPRFSAALEWCFRKVGLTALFGSPTLALYLKN